MDPNRPPPKKKKIPRDAWIRDPTIKPGWRVARRIKKNAEAVVAEKRAKDREDRLEESLAAYAREVEERLAADNYHEEAVPEAVEDEYVEFAGFGDTMEMSHASDEDNPVDDRQGNITDDDEEEPAEPAEPTDPLYPGCPISSREASTLIFAFAMRHSLTKAGTTELLKMLKLLLPEEANVPATKYLLEKALNVDVKSSVTKCVYCEKCHASIKTQGDVCERCNSPIDESQLIKDGQFFLMFDVQRSLEKILELKEVSTNLMTNLLVRIEKRDQPGYTSTIRYYSDIVDGDCYRKLTLGQNDITCTINTDGVNLFNSSSYSIWPLFLSINELDYKLRRNNTVLAGLWFGSKPSIHTFLSPFVDQMNSLSENGITWTYGGCGMKSRVFFTTVAADSVARAPLQGMKQFNGKNGCPYCLNPGESWKYVDEDGKERNKWIYLPCEAEKRTQDAWKKDLMELKDLLEKSKTNQVLHVNGLLSASPFLALMKFNIVDGFVVDYMHTALLGVLKAVTCMFFDSKHHKEAFYLGKPTKVIEEINGRLSKCKIPSEVNRTTRDISESAYWKANEWKTWLLICIPVLQGILKSPYLEHLAKFVLAISLLIGDKIRPSEIDTAEKLLLEFNNEARTLYTNYVMTFNMHLITHAPDCVRKWGPLSGYSLFQFEHANGVLTKMFKGTRVVEMQIVRNVIVLQDIRTASGSVTNPSAKLFLDSMEDHKTYFSKIFKCANDVTFVGPRKRYTFNEHESSLVAGKNCNVQLEILKDVWSYKHIFVKGKKFGAQESAKISNSVVKIARKLYLLRKLLLLVFSDSTTKAICFVNPVNAERNKLHYFQSDLLYTCTSVSDAVKAFSCDLIDPKLKFICLHNSGGDKLTHLCQLANSIELE